jgi:hypothetical protein
MSARTCEWDYEDNFREPPLFCGQPATVKLRNQWLCERHADELERMLAQDARESAGGPDGMDEL